MPWIILFVAGVLEVIWATAMKSSNGFTLLVPSVVTVVTMLGSFFLLSIAMRSLPLGTSYIVWTGIGAVGAFIAGIILHGEAVTAQRMAAAGMIILGMLMMKSAS
ncbi:multidrug efflux SMR transporter [Shimia thalassica]|uniref:DMT family transporter n=1 Tax=Shimia thalassica TaxID=1715693 RepID=UPI0027365BF5|nr:multidrug efflux SMR transporter [Shimia thalassica]MDP2578345.1 multidrug efflux SMR transporter [Shimia thalassica]